MRLTSQQKLALEQPYTEADAERMAKKGPSVQHMSTRWISSDVQVLVIFTVAVFNDGSAFWHVSLGVKVRDVGSIPTAALEKGMRRRLRKLGQEVLKGVGDPAGEDDWTIDEKALHLMRRLTHEEIEHMGARHA
jgi:hypothetical protein